MRQIYKIYYVDVLYISILYFIDYYVNYIMLKTLNFYS